MKKSEVGYQDLGMIQKKYVLTAFYSYNLNAREKLESLPM